MKAHGINILVEPIYREKTEGGIILPDAAKDSVDDLQKAVVLLVGDGDYVGGSVEMKIKKGDFVWYRGLKGGHGINLQEDKTTPAKKVITISDVILYETV